jgi:hypothetical protein
MTKTLKTLVKDIYDFLHQPSGLPEDWGRSLGAAIAERVTDKFKQVGRANYLRLSNLGSKCNRKLWYSIHAPELGEPLSGATRLKFLVGDILEVLLIQLAKAAGHKVTGEQTKLDLHGVVGHRDAVIDGVTVDVKSSSSYGMRKFVEHKLDTDDPFGYRIQLDAYRHAAENDGLVTQKDYGAFLAIDKTLGHLALDIYPKLDVDYEKLVAEKRAAINSPTPPDRGYEDEPDGRSGNRKIPMECSYCEYKKACWPGLRAFNYSGKPVFLSHVEREPRVEEINIAP